MILRIADHETADAYYITSGPDDGNGARRAMEGALRQAGLQPGDIQRLLGAAGGAEAIFTILALRDQIASPTPNLENGDAAADGVDLVSREARRMTMEHAFSNGFGFGGVKASVIFDVGNDRRHGGLTCAFLA